MTEGNVRLGVVNDEVAFLKASRSQVDCKESNGALNKILSEEGLDVGEFADAIARKLEDLDYKVQRLN